MTVSVLDADVALYVDLRSNDLSAQWVDTAIYARELEQVREIGRAHV